MLTSIVNICLGIVLAIPTVSSDVDPIDRWKDYIYFKTNNFYLLEKQYYNQITCQINVPSIVAGWELGKEQLKKNKDVDFEFKEEFAKFTLHVHRYSVVTIERPKFDIRVVSNNASVNTQAIENEIQFINEDMQRQISDVAKVLEGYFDEQRLPRRTNVELKKLTVKGENVILNLTNKEMEREETYSDNYRNVVVKNHGTPVLERKDAYIKVGNNKLALKSSSIFVKRDAVTVEEALSFDYQSLKRIGTDHSDQIVFPRRITDVMQKKINNITQQVELEIHLDKCFAR